MHIQENISLAPHTTLRLGGPASYFVEVENLPDLRQAIEFARERSLPVFILGGGSNILVSDEGFPGVVIKINLRGRTIVEEDDTQVLIEVAAGEGLDDCIAWTVEKGWWGMENLSFIPGRVGALVIQNVNAYGVKAEHVVESVRVLDRNTLAIKQLSNQECLFRYRGSIFNKEEKDRYIVLSVRLHLAKNALPRIAYVDIQKHMFGKVGTPSLSQMRDMVIAIRKGKGFDPNVYWSAGSFFSNLMLERERLPALRDRILEVAGEHVAQKYDQVLEKFYEEGEKDPHLEVGKVKIPTGFILDQVLGLKGYRRGGAYVSKMHSQTFINDGGASAQDVYELYLYMKKVAKEKLDLDLVHEPEFVGFDEL